MLADHVLSFAGSPRAKAVMARQEGNPAVSYKTQTNDIGRPGTIVESFYDNYPDDAAYGSTVVYAFANSAAASSFTSEYPAFVPLAAAATTTAPAQTTSITVEDFIPTEQRTTSKPSPPNQSFLLSTVS